MGTFLVLSWLLGVLLRVLLGVLLVSLVELVDGVAVLGLVHVMSNLVDLELFWKAVEGLRVDSVVSQECLRKAEHC